MSNREKLRERIFGILYTLFGSLMFIVGLTTGSSKALLGGFAFLIIGSFSWIKLAMHSNPKKTENSRPVKQNAAHMAREAELEAQKQQQELAHQERRESYKSSPEPLQIRQWNKTYLWDWKIKRHVLDRPLYFWSVGKDGIDIFTGSGFGKDICVIRPKDGVWCLCPLDPDVTVHMNSESVRNKCPDMSMNTQRFTVRKGQEQELLPGDCFVIIRGPAVAYFRIDRWSII